jgi:hypothetical protein
MYMLTNAKLISRFHTYFSCYRYSHEPELLFTHRLKLGFVHPLRLPGDVNQIFRSRTGLHRCAPDCLSIFLRVSSPFPSRRHQFYRCECHHPDGSLASRPMLTTHRSGIFGYTIVARPKRRVKGRGSVKERKIAR